MKTLICDKLTSRTFPDVQKYLACPTQIRTRNLITDSQLKREYYEQAMDQKTKPI